MRQNHRVRSEVCTIVSATRSRRTSIATSGHSTKGTLLISDAVFAQRYAFLIFVPRLLNTPDGMVLRHKCELMQEHPDMIRVLQPSDSTRRPIDWAHAIDIITSPSPCPMHLGMRRWGRS